MALSQVVAGARILISDLNAYYSLLKGSAGEAVTLIYNAAGSLIFQPSSDPASSTQLVQIKKNDGTVRVAFTAGGQVLNAQGADIASATTTDLSTATGNYVVVTGTTTITAFGTVQAGTVMVIKFAGILTLTYNATSMILQGSTSFTSAAGDVLTFVSEGSGNWREISRRLAAAALTSITTSEAALSSDVTISTSNTFVDGPSVSLAAGTWFITGAVVVKSGFAGSAQAKLWDGSTVEASGESECGANGNLDACIHLSGIVVLGGTTTMKISATHTNVSAAAIKAALVTNGAGNNASYIRAVKTS